MVHVSPQTNPWRVLFFWERDRHLDDLLSIEQMLLQPRSAPDRTLGELGVTRGFAAPLRATLHVVRAFSSARVLVFISSVDSSTACDRGQGFGVIHFRSRSLRQVGCYTFHSGFRPSWPPTNSKEQATAFRGSADEPGALRTPHAQASGFLRIASTAYQSWPTWAPNGFSRSDLFLLFLPSTGPLLGRFSRSSEDVPSGRGRGKQGRTEPSLGSRHARTSRGKFVSLVFSTLPQAKPGRGWLVHAHSSFGDSSGSRAPRSTNTLARGITAHNPDLGLSPAILRETSRGTSY